MHIGIGSHRRTHVDPDGCGVDQLYLSDPLRLDALNMSRKLFPGDFCFQRRDQALQHHGRFSRTGNARYHGQPAFGEGRIQRLYGMDRAGFHPDRSKIKQFFAFRPGAQAWLMRRGQERPDQGIRIACDLPHDTLGKDPAAARAGLRSHFDQPVRMRQHLGIMIHQHDGIAIGHQIVHHAGEPFQVGGMQANGWLIQHIQHARGAIAYRPRQLGALALAGGQGGCGPVQRQIGKPQIHQPPGRMEKGFADALRHGAHFLRQGCGNILYPGNQIGQRKRTDMIQRHALQPQRPRAIRQPGAAAIRADILLQEFFHPLHALFILYLVQGVEYRGCGAVIGKVHLPRADALLAFGAIKDVLFYHGAVVNDFFFFVSQIPERNIGAHAHGAAHIGHQRPHQAVPGRHRPLIHGQAFIRHQGGAIHCAHRAGAAAGFASPTAVKGQLLRPDGGHDLAAYGAAHFLFRRVIQRGRHIVSVFALIHGQPGEHKPQAVQQFCGCAKGAADPRHPGPLMQRQRRRHIAHVIHLGVAGLGHPPARIG